MKLMLLLIAPVLLVGLAACNSETLNPDSAVAQASTEASATESSAGADSTRTQTNTAEETREPNAEWQEPAFDGQTRAPIPTETERWRLETVAEGLNHPWALELLPDGAMLITERPGSLRIVS